MVGSHDLPGRLIKPFSNPAGVQLGQGPSQAVVLPEHQGVEGGQADVLVHPFVTWKNVTGKYPGFDIQYQGIETGIDSYFGIGKHWKIHYIHVKK